MRSQEARLRAVSRIALYGGLCLVAAVAGLLFYLAGAPLVREERETWHETDYAALEEVRLLREYVRIDTSEETGDVAAGARFLAARLEEAGIEPHLEVLGSGDANLWAIVEGEEPEAVVLHHHIDVTAAEHPERWPSPPFAAEIDGPWLYGRGAFDMKSIGVAQLVAVIDLVRSGVRPRRSVILLATSGEETGSELGTQWILREHPELVERFGLVLTEGGVVEGRARDDLKYWGTEFAQKRHYTLVACSPSREVLEQVRRDLRPFGAIEDRYYLVDEVRAFLPDYAPTRDAPHLRRLLSDPEALLRDRAAIVSLPHYLWAMFRNELHGLEVREVPGGGFELEVSIHLLPGVELAEVEDDLLPPWLFWGLETTIRTEPAADHGSPVDHPVLALIEEVIRDRHPDAPVGPLFLPWTSTDARFFRAHGIPSYGFAPFLVFTTDAIRVDGVGERISLPDFVAGVDIYRELLRRLVS
jgi:acetylornithine deacetylase/succinyl-diaminopimelate desuccinylase-like protein